MLQNYDGASRMLCRYWALTSILADYTVMAYLRLCRKYFVSEPGFLLPPRRRRCITVSTLPCDDVELAPKNSHNRTVELL